MTNVLKSFKDLSLLLLIENQSAAPWIARLARLDRGPSGSRQPLTRGGATPPAVSLPLCVTPYSILAPWEVSE